MEKFVRSKKLYRSIGLILTFILAFSIASGVSAPTTIIADELENWKDEPWDYKDMIQKEQTLGFNLELVNGRYIVNYVSPLSTAYQIGLKTGDRLLAVNDTPLSNRGLEATRSLLRVPVGTVLKLTIQRNDSQFDVMVICVEAEEKGFAWETVNDMIVFQITYFDDRSMENIKNAYDRIVAMDGKQRIRGLVFDLRNNRSNNYKHVVDFYNLIQSFTQSRTTLLLVNDQTSNAADFLAMVLQKYNGAVIIGSPSQHTDPDFQLSYGIAQKLKAIYWLEKPKVIEIAMAVNDSFVNVQGHMGTIEHPPIISKISNQIVVPVDFAIEAVGYKFLWDDNHNMHHIVFENVRAYIDREGIVYDSNLKKVTQLEKYNGAYYATLDQLYRYLGYDFEMVKKDAPADQQKTMKANSEMKQVSAGDEFIIRFWPKQN